MGALSSCTEPDCPRLTRAGRCEEHRLAKRREIDRRRPNARARGYDRRWERTRHDFLLTHSWCEDCGERATDVDHRDGLGPLGPRGYDETNLRGLCGSCHSTRTARAQPGGWNAR